jgi:hypothetical protein
MADIDLKLDPKFDGKSKEEILSVFDQEVERFSKFMETIGDGRIQGGLLPPERVLLKTYLVHKFRGRLNG